MSAERSSRPVRTGPARPARPADRLRAAEARNRDADFARSPAPRRGPEAARPPADPSAAGSRAAVPTTGVPTSGVRRRGVPTSGARSTGPAPTSAAPGRPAEPRGASVSARPRPAKPAADGGRIRGVVAVLGDVPGHPGRRRRGLASWASASAWSPSSRSSSVTAIATLVVRRRDLLSVIVAPPLVFVAVAGVNIALAPSASFNLPTIATLLVRGFPTMAIATGVALVLGLIRLAARR